MQQTKKLQSGRQGLLLQPCQNEEQRTREIHYWICPMQTSVCCGYHTNITIPYGPVLRCNPQSGSWEGPYFHSLSLRRRFTSASSGCFGVDAGHPHNSPRWVIEPSRSLLLERGTPSVRSAPSLLQFRRDLKTTLFQSSYSSP